MYFPAMASAGRGITKSGLAPDELALERFQARARLSFMSDRNSTQTRKDTYWTFR